MDLSGTRGLPRPCASPNHNVSACREARTRRPYKTASAPRSSHTNTPPPSHTHLVIQTPIPIPITITTHYPTTHSMSNWSPSSQTLVGSPYHSSSSSSGSKAKSGSGAPHPGYAPRVRPVPLPSDSGSIYAPSSSASSYSTQTSYRPSGSSPIQIHPALGYAPYPRLGLNLARPAAPYALSYPSPQTPAEYAFQPAMASITVVLPLPGPYAWSATARPSRGNSLSVEDVLNAIVMLCMERASSTVFNSLDSATRASVSAAFEERTRGSTGDRNNGLKKVDFLGSQVQFLGLAHMGGDKWQICTSAATSALLS